MCILPMGLSCLSKVDEHEFVALQFPGPDLKIAMSIYIRDAVLLVPSAHAAITDQISSCVFARLANGDTLPVTARNR